jgi:hypothetical protein
LDETTDCNGATETEPDSGMMQSIEEHQDIPKGVAVVMTVGELRKRRRVQNLVAERHQKRKERARGYRGSGGSWLPPAGRCPVVQKWHGERKPHQENSDPGKS